MSVTVALPRTSKRRCESSADRPGASYTVEVLGLVTAEVARNLDPDLLPFDGACRGALGDDAVQMVDWDDPDVDWTAFDAIILRSPWDYTERLAEFLEWAQRVSTQTQLLNSFEAVSWSADKRYLADLAEAGVPVAQTLYVAPGEPAPIVEGLHVVKPTVGAGSVGARRCESHEVGDHVAALHAGGLTAIVQPYLDLIDERGETCLCFVPSSPGAGLELSHAFRKGAILTSYDVEQKGGLFAKEDITQRTPSEAERRLADAVLATDLVDAFDLSYARIDIAPVRVSGVDSFVVMEVELIEPSFYLDVTPGSADRFARTVIDRLHR